MHRIEATGYQLLETVYRPLFKPQAVLRPLKKGLVFSPETSATTFPPTAHNISEERTPLIQAGARLNSLLIDTSVCPQFVFLTNRDYFTEGQ